MRVDIFRHFLVGKHIINMLSNRFFISAEQNSHLISAKPHRLVLQTDINLDLSVLSLIDYNFILFHTFLILLQRYSFFLI